MNIRFEGERSNRHRVLLYSQRNVFEPVAWRCLIYEFEDVIRQIDSVEMIAPQKTRWSRLSRANAIRIQKYTHCSLNPGISKIRLENYYDLFFAICQGPSDLLNLTVIKQWKDYCKTSICWLDEIWAHQIPKYKGFLKILSKFDYVLLNTSQSVDSIKKLIGNKCSYISLGVDAELFFPHPESVKRLVDVLSIGRRSEITHQALLKMARKNKIFYVYDNIKTLNTYSCEQHRFLLANMIKRSRYFIVYPGKIDSNVERGTQEETGARYFEGAAAGAIMIGEKPNNEVFKNEFPWDNVVIKMPYSSEDVEKILMEIEKEGCFQEKFRNRNIVQCLLYHDWVYRWEQILKIAGIQAMPALLERKGRLKALAEKLDGSHN